MEDTIPKQKFDSDIFGVPFYRVVNFDPARLVAALPVRTASAPAVIDAKLPADDVDTAWLLMEHGFLKIGTQFEMMWVSPGSLSAPVPATVAECLKLDDKDLDAHARNFTWDRFSLDRRFPKNSIYNLYRNWISNSTSGRRQVVHIGRNFCTFTEVDGEIRIDLVSVLDKRQGIGRHLLAALQNHAHTVGARTITVKTECENRPAWSLYSAAGFRPLAFHLVLHFVAPGTF